ncbi:MAG: four helix bundle protein [Saprospiraceae bacterium]|nr:four helix bundle protein [Saprospiraceae bacterium]
MVTEIYKFTESYPKSELSGLTSQIEVLFRFLQILQKELPYFNKEFSQFLSIALGSVSELETQLIVSITFVF